MCPSIIMKYLAVLKLPCELNVEINVAFLVTCNQQALQIYSKIFPD